MNNFLSLKLYKNNDLFMEKPQLDYKKTGNKYEFILDNVFHTITVFNESLVIIRDNNESTLEITIKKDGNHKCRYFLKEIDAFVDIIVDSAEFNIQDDKLEVYYQLESDDKFTKLELDFN